MSETNFTFCTEDQTKFCITAVYFYNNILKGGRKKKGAFCSGGNIQSKKIPTVPEHVAEASSVSTHVSTQT